MGTPAPDSERRGEAQDAAGTPRAVRLRFGRVQRLTKALEFESVHRARVRKVVGPLTVSGAPNGLSRARLGLSIGRRVGPAVVRNRIKRLIREAFRLEQREMPPGLDLVVSVRSAAGAELGMYRESLREAALELRSEWERRERRAAARAAKGAEKSDGR